MTIWDEVDEVLEEYEKERFGVDISKHMRTHNKMAKLLRKLRKQKGQTYIDFTGAMSE